MNRPQRIRELVEQVQALERQTAALRAEIDEVKKGCGRRLASDQWYSRCAGIEFEYNAEFCTECGGTLVLADNQE